MSGSSFFDEFNASLPVAEAIMGEEWRINGAVWKAICIDDLRAGVTRIGGGKFRNATVGIDVRLSVARESGVTFHSIVEARGQRLRVLDLGSSGDDSVYLTCGPEGVRTG